MNFKPFCNLSDFDIFAKRLGLYYNGKEKIGSYFGLMLTLIYILFSMIIFCYYTISILKREEMQVHDSTEYSNDIPFIDLNNSNLFYFAFGVENNVNASRFIDETIYRARAVFYYGEKSKSGTFETKEYRDLKIEKCKIEKFGKDYQNLFTKGEFDESYCVDKFDLTLIGGFIYNKFSCIRIFIYPCVNTTANNNHCKPQEIIDEILAGGYFSILLKDIGLNPNNFSHPTLPTIQDFYTTISKDFYRDVIFNYEITDVKSDSGIFYEKSNTERYLRFDKVKESFYLRSDDFYYRGKNICKIEIRLSDNIHVQRRSYKKMSNVFSTTGGYMQVLYTFFMVLSLIPNSFTFQSIIVNSLINIDFNESKKYLCNHYTCMEHNNIILNNSKKEQIEQTKKFNIIKHIKQNNEIGKKNKTHNLNNKQLNFENIINISKSIKSSGNKNSNSIDKVKNISYISQNNNASKIDMINPNIDLNVINSDIASIIKSHSNKSLFNYPKENTFFDKVKKKGIKEIKFNIFEYYCFGKCNKKNKKIDLFNKGNFLYREEMDIIHIFRHLLDFEKTVTEKNNITEQMKIFSKSIII